MLDWAQLLDLFAFTSVVLRGLTLSCQSLVIGGLVFTVLSEPIDGGAALIQACSRMIRWSALALGVAQSAYLAANTAILMETTELSFSAVAGAVFFVAGAVSTVIALGLIIPLSTNPRYRAVTLVLSFGLIAASVATSHAAARIAGRPPLVAMTALHQTASATWVGGLPYFLLSLTLCRDPATARALSARFSRLAQISVGVLFASGAGLSLVYVEEPLAMFGTAYGVMVSTKAILFGLLLVLGAFNFFIVKRVQAGDMALLGRMRRFGEAEIGIGFTALLVAGSLTSLPPAVDMQSGRATGLEIVRRLTPVWPRLTTPSPREIYKSRVSDAGAGDLESFVPGQLPAAITAEEIALSEFNHHWAGVFVLCAGLLAIAARAGLRWARHWPWIFFGLGLFLLLMADADYWPLGRIPFWKGFANSEVLQHRLILPLIAAFAWFEWRVQTGRTRSPRAAFIFPIVCLLGAAMLLTHSHSLNNLKEELFAEISHVPIAVMSIVAGCSRWLELRLRDGPRNTLSWMWPISLALIGAWLLNYRES